MRILLLADIHIGSVKDTDYVYDTITEILDRELLRSKCDMVVILGDYFHRLFRANESYVSLAVNIMSYLIRLCKKTKTKIRLVYGTESHEMSQYRLFNYHLSSKSVDMKLFTTVTEENLGGVKILYVPEEYIDDKRKHYKDTLFSGEKYDYIFGHGVISEGMPMVKFMDVESKSTEKKVPHFKAGELRSAGKLTVFGHYHIGSKVDTNVHYLGSLFRNSFGEEEPKGYGIIEDGKFKFIKNEAAYDYLTYKYPDDSSIYSDLEKIVDEVNKVKKKHADIFDGSKPGKVRLVFELPDNVDSSFRENLQSLLFNEKSIVSLIKESKVITGDTKSELELEYDFILDKGLPITDKIFRYITKTFPDTDLTLKELTSFINDDLKL